MNAVLFAVEQIYVMVIYFVYLEYKKISSTRSYQSCTQNYIPCLGQRGQKPYPVQRNIVPLIGHPPGNFQFRGFRWVFVLVSTYGMIPRKSGGLHLPCNIETILVPTARRFFWPRDFC